MAQERAKKTNSDITSLEGKHLKRESEQKTAEERLRESERLYRAVVETATDAILQCMNGKIIFWNKSAKRIFGYTKEEAIGKSMTMLMPDEEIAHMHLSGIDRYIKTGESKIIGKRPYEVTARRKDGVFIDIELSVADNKPAKGHSFTAIIRDITERKKAEKALQRKRQEALRQNKLASNLLNIVEITANSMNFDESINRILPLINRLLESNCSLIYSIDHEKQILKPTNQAGLKKEDLAYFTLLPVRYGKQKFFSAIFDQNIAMIKDLQNYKSGLPEDFLKFINQVKASSAIIMPVVYAGKTKFILISYFSKKKVFSGRVEEIVRKLNKHLEISFLAYKQTFNLLNQSMNFAEQIQITKTMGEIDRAILGSATSEEVIYKSTRLLSNVLAGDIIELLVLVGDKRALNLAAVSENHKQFLNINEEFFVKEIKSWANAMLAIPSYYPNISEDEITERYEKRFVERDIKSLLVVPLLSKGKIIGILSIGNKRTAFYSTQNLKIAQRMANQIALALSNTGLIKELQDLLIGVVNSLVSALDAKSHWTKGHSQRVSKIAVDIGKALGLDEDQLYDLQLAALFHDIGKIGTYDIVLDKHDKLSQKEAELVKKHPSKTFEIVSQIHKMNKIAEIAKYHHERWDGEGYPAGLAGEETPYLSRILTVADTYDAMVSDRPYRKGLSKDEAIEELKRFSGSQLDPDIVEVFISQLKQNH